jgi:2-C-methyl-D-erythritol 4-phosphate cytidylyltransferase
VASGLASLPEGSELVLVHDAARPLFDLALVERLLAGLDETCEGVVPAIPLEDSIKRVSGDRFLEAEVDRRSVWRVQTPQLFRRAPLEKALGRAAERGEDSPDCSQMLTRAGYRVKVVDGDPLNLKVTRPRDLKLAETYLRARWGGQL